MRKKALIFYCITLCLICQGLFTKTAGAVEITEAQKAAVVDNCSTIRENLVKVQQADARARVYLGRYYEMFLTDLMTPLNLWLVENNLSRPELIENQKNFAERRTKFTNDYITYQKLLEGLVGMDCKNEPVKFYDRLADVREARARVQRNVTALRGMLDTQITLVTEVKDAL